MDSLLQVFNLANLRLILGLYGRDPVQQLLTVLVELLIQGDQLLIGLGKLLVCRFPVFSLVDPFIPLFLHVLELIRLLLVLLLQLHQLSLECVALIGVLLLESLDVMPLLLAYLLVMLLQAMVGVLLLLQAFLI